MDTYSSEEIKKVQLRLLEMAVSIRNILESHDIPHMITYGTLLGAVRHGGFIPWDDDFDFYIIGDSYDEAVEYLRAELPCDIFIEDAKSEPLYFHGWAHAKDLGTEALCTLFPQDNLYKHHGICVDLYRAFCITSNFDQINRLRAHADYLRRKLAKNIISKEEFEEKIRSIETKLTAEEIRVSSIDLSNDEDIVGFISVFDDSMPAKDIFPLKKYDFEDTYFWGPQNADKLLTRCYGNYMALPPEEKRLPHYSSVRFI